MTKLAITMLILVLAYLKNKGNFSKTAASKMASQAGEKVLTSSEIEIPYIALF